MTSFCGLSQIMEKIQIMQKHVMYFNRLLMRKYLFKAINKDTDTSSTDAVLMLPFTCSNSTVDDVNDVLLMSLLLTWNMFHAFF